MNPRKLTETSKKLSWLLRHGATESGLRMDAAGWAAEHDVMALLHVTPQELRAAVEENTKARLQWEGGRIRACQGHSTPGTPVTADALEATWEVFDGQGPLWHGTGLDVLTDIARDGLRPMGRTHVHLAAEAESKVGKRAGVAVLLEVSSSSLRQRGLGVFVSPNGVVLVRQVPADCILRAVPCTRAAQAEQARLHTLFGEGLSACGVRPAPQSPPAHASPRPCGGGTH